MKIVRTQNSDITSVQQIYQEARDYQLKTVGYGWSVFSKEFILKEISEKRHYKAVDLYNEITGVFSVVYSEPLIWDDYEGTKAIYLHRMAMKNRFRGSGFAKRINRMGNNRSVETQEKFYTNRYLGKQSGFD